MTTVQVIGSPISPYVRKVLAACAFKNIAVEIDPVVPFYGDDRFTALSPLRRIPVLRDGDLSLCDSSVICQYLEDRHPAPALYPADIGDRARARWVEEYADTRIGDVFVWRLFNNAVISPAVFGAKRDDALRQRTIDAELPMVMNDVEAVAPEDGFFFGDLSIADIAVAPFFDNLAWARVEPDWARWPRTEGWLARTRAATALGDLAKLAGALARTPIPQHRARLAALGVALTAETVATATPKRGPMTV